jgi:putative YphP/YqiW family bacilliredoxin
VTVFAGMERKRSRRRASSSKPTARAAAGRAAKDGKLVKMIQRQDIEGKDPAMVARR